jgi:hypothetical protein
VRRLALIAFLLAACGPKVHMDESPFEQDDPRAGDAIDEPKQKTYAELPEAPPGELLREGTISRAALTPILAAGPGPLLAHFEVSAELDDGNRFLGWRLVAFDPKHRDFDGVDLVPGDILVALNGVALSKPKDLQDVWDGLAAAPAIVADIQRGDSRFQLRWTITN